MKKARRLVNLDISEVSSVTVGAGKGVRVKLLKRHNERNAMQTDIFKSGAVPVNIAKHAFESVCAGEISEYRFGKIQQELAGLMGISLAEFFKTDAGLATLAPRRALSPAQNLDLVAKEYNDPTPQRAQPGEEEDGDTDELDGMAREHRANWNKANPGKRPMTHAEAVTAVLHTPEGAAAYQRAKAAHLQKNA